MYVSSIPLYLVQIVIYSCLIHWSSSHRNEQNFTEKNATLEILKHNGSYVTALGNASQETLSEYEPSKFEIDRERFSNDGTSDGTDGGLRSVVGPKRTKRCLLTMMALGTVVGLSSMFFGSPAPPPPRPPPPRPPPPPVYKTVSISFSPPKPPPPPPRPPPPRYTSPPRPPPRPTTTTRRPTTTTRRRTTTTRRPTTTTRRPTTTTRRPTTTTRKPTTTKPKPTTTKPKPTTTTPKPTTTTSKPTTTTPKPTTTAITTTTTTTTMVPASNFTTLETHSNVIDVSRDVKTLYKPPKNCETSWGSCVIGGTPKYSIENSTVVMKVEEKKVKDVWVLEFKHPVTLEIVRLPRDIGDDYVINGTHQVFTIFVDRQNRTYLIYEGMLMDDKSASQFNATDIVSTETTYIVTNINTNINMVVNYNKMLSTLREKRVGLVVIDGVPKYDAGKAVFMMNVRKRIVNGMWVIEFVHPHTGATIQVPEEVGDDYVIMSTQQVFKIFVDFEGRTYMLFMGSNSKREQKLEKRSGSSSIGGVPAYNISNAVRVESTVQKIVDGILVIEWMHPITQKIIQVPFNVGDQHVERETLKVFLIFVDNDGRTLLIFKGLLRSDAKAFSVIAGNVVTNGTPKYDVSNATIVTDTVQKYGLDGKPVIEFIHPLTLQIIQISVDVGQLYFERGTKRVFVIFVDTLGRTLLIFKGLNSKSEEIMRETIVGTVVINGMPKYEVSNATVVMETVRKVRADGSVIIEFVHPITRQRAQIPANIGDEHIDHSTRKVFVIFVDHQGRTLLIFKGWLDVEEETASASEVGAVVVKGEPSYDLSTAIIVRETVQKIGAEGFAVLEFEHPVVRQKIQIPLKVGDEYRNRETGEIFKIYVDILGRTYLIFRGFDSKKPEAGEQMRGVRIVVRGVPKYDESTATFVENTEQALGKDGTILIVFQHPFTRETIELPYDVGDVYVNPKTRHVYKICVDREGRTLMIYIGMDREMKEHWVSVVKKGLPEYDISKAIVVMDSEIKIARKGKTVIEFLEFRHPLSRLMIRVPTLGADAYIKPGTMQVFIICVDNRGRTLLVFKGLRGSSAWEHSGEDISNDNFNDNQNININTNVNTNEIGGVARNSHKWGSRVVDGNPPYNLSSAIYVMKTEKKIGANGAWAIEFKHPDTDETIRVPLEGADEYVDRRTRKVFIICVDRHEKTLLVFKGFLENSTSTKQPTVVYSSESDENDNSNSNYNINENLNVNTNINENIVSVH